MFVPALARAELIYHFSGCLGRSWRGAVSDPCRKRGIVVAERHCACRGRCERGPEGEPGVRPERNQLLVIPNILATKYSGEGKIRGNYRMAA